MKPLRAPPPPGRTAAQLWNHYQSEAAIASRLKAAPTRLARSEILASMYDELFKSVPDHQRLTRRDNPSAVARANRKKLSVIRRWVSSTDTFVEFGAGDCEFAASIASSVQKVIAVDISDQRKSERQWPGNFNLLVYDGYDLPGVLPGSIDVIFSDQLLEHLHPDDAEHHLELCYRLLRPGGRYVIRTPHADSGPWDISRYFCDDAEGFHLKEWTYHDLVPALHRAGYSDVLGAWAAKGICQPLPMTWFSGIERLARLVPKRMRRRPIRLLIPTLFCVAIK